MSRLPSASSRPRSRSLIPCAVISTAGVSGSDVPRRASSCIAKPRAASRPCTTSLCTSWPWIVTVRRLVDALDHLERVTHPEAKAHHLGPDHSHRSSFRA